jgi:hypothetical protein
MRLVVVLPLGVLVGAVLYGLQRLVRARPTPPMTPRWINEHAYERGKREVRMR